MKSLFREIFEYHLHYNQLLVDEFEKHLEKLPERSFPLYCHNLNAHQIWNARILDIEPFGVRAVHELGECKDINQKNHENTLKILDEIDLNHTLKYSNSKGKEFSNTVQEILFHVANHHTHHRGQIISDFRNSGIDPLVTDYIFYKR